MDNGKHLLRMELYLNKPYQPTKSGSTNYTMEESCVALLPMLSSERIVLRPTMNVWYTLEREWSMRMDKTDGL